MFVYLLACSIVVVVVIVIIIIIIIIIIRVACARNTCVLNDFHDVKFVVPFNQINNAICAFSYPFKPFIPDQKRGNAYIRAECFVLRD